MEGSFKALPLTVLSQLGRHWVSAQRPLLAGHDTLKGHLIGLDRAQKQIEAAEVLEQDLSKNKALAVVIKKCGEADAGHDDAVRFIGCGLDLAELGAKNDLEALDVYKVLRQKLLPTGLSVVTASYEEEIGQARAVDRSLTAEDNVLLKKIGTPEYSLFDAHQRRLKEALTLEGLEAQRAVLEAEVEGAKGHGKQIQDAANYWIRTFRSTLNQIETEDMPETDRRILLIPFEKALSRTIKDDPEPKV